MVLASFRAGGFALPALASLPLLGGTSGCTAPDRPAARATASLEVRETSAQFSGGGAPDVVARMGVEFSWGGAPAAKPGGNPTAGPQDRPKNPPKSG